MNLNLIVQKLDVELNGKNRKQTVDSLINVLIEDPEELSKNLNFFKLPLQTIFLVISKINFDNIDEYDDDLKKIIYNFIYNTIQSHFEEKETILLLQNLRFDFSSFSYDDILSIFNLFKNCPFI